MSRATAVSRLNANVPLTPASSFSVRARQAISSDGAAVHAGALPELSSSLIVIVETLSQLIDAVAFRSSPDNVQLKVTSAPSATGLVNAALIERSEQVASR